MSKPTNNDWNAFANESQKVKTDVLYEYICEGYGNMQEIAKDILKDDNKMASQRVSCITRCYGFEGNNKGIMRSIEATRADVQAFVKKYSDGLDYLDRGLTMRKFLEDRVASRNKARTEKPKQKQSEHKKTIKSEPVYEDKPVNEGFEYFKNLDPDTKFLLVLFVIGLVVARLIGFGWVLSVIVDFVLCCVIYGAKVAKEANFGIFGSASNDLNDEDIYDTDDYEIYDDDDDD